MAKVDWDQTEDKASTGFEVLPKGRYLCVIESSEEKPTKAHDGAFFEFIFVVSKGTYANRKLWARLNIKNPSEVAQQIGREQFKALCIAAGKETVKKTEELDGKTVVCLVDIERGTGGYSDKNRVSGFMSPEDFRPGPDTAPARAGKASAPKGGDVDDDDIPF